jgi:hypothetical protein
MLRYTPIGRRRKTEEKMVGDRNRPLGLILDCKKKLVAKSEGKRPRGKVCVVGRIILKLILKK